MSPRFVWGVLWGVARGTVIPGNNPRDLAKSRNTWVDTAGNLGIPSFIGAELSAPALVGDQFMARSRSLAHYPAVYWEIIENIGKGGKEFVIEQESRPMALKLQGHFYAFIGALRRTAAQANLRGQEPVNQRIIDCAAMSQVILVQVESMADGRARVHIRHREQSWQAAAFAAGKFVEDAPPAEVEAKIEASKQELLKKLGMTGDSKK